MFQRLPDAGGERVSFTIDGRPAEALSGDSVAAALIATRTGAAPPASAAARSIAPGSSRTG